MFLALEHFDLRTKRRSSTLHVKICTVVVRSDTVPVLSL